MFFLDSFNLAKAHEITSQFFLPVLGKSFEQVIHYWMNQYLAKYQLLQNCQFWFRSKRSTIDASIFIKDEVRNDWNFKTVKTQCPFINLKVAFDSVDHMILQENCDAYGFRGPVLDILKPHLENRLQYIAIYNK